MLRFWPLLLVLPACRPATPPPAPDADDPSAPARVVLARTDAGPDLPPALRGDTVILRVEYGGGCEDHTFHLRDDRRGDTLALLLHHDAHGDTCEGLLYDELRLEAPEEVRTHAGPVVLVAPDGEVFGLR